MKASNSPENSLNRLYEKVSELANRAKEKNIQRNLNEYENKFIDFIDDDLNIPSALAIAWDVLKDKELSDGKNTIY